MLIKIWKWVSSSFHQEAYTISWSDKRNIVTKFVSCFHVPHWSSPSMSFLLHHPYYTSSFETWLVKSRKDCFETSPTLSVRSTSWLLVKVMVVLGKITAKQSWHEVISHLGWELNILWSRNKHSSSLAIVSLGIAIDLGLPGGIHNCPALNTAIFSALFLLWLVKDLT
jgi:hypothetical protein